MKNLTVKTFVGLFVVAAVLLQSCKKDSETYSFLLNERGRFVEEPGGTTSLGFTAINIVGDPDDRSSGLVGDGRHERTPHLRDCADDLSRRPGRHWPTGRKKRRRIPTSDSEPSI